MVFFRRTSQIGDWRCLIIDQIESIARSGREMIVNHGRLDVALSVHLYPLGFLGICPAAHISGPIS